jgi:cytochrome oxidase Cu insertion factor (SCO1/SenC/PrrC family)
MNQPASDFEVNMASKSQKKRRLEKQKRQARQRRLYALLFGVLLVAVAGFVFVSRDGGSTAGEEDLAELPVAPAIGARAPEFSLPDVNGQPVSLSDFRGKPVAMMFFHTY